jgi:hypothetical protein
VHLGQVGARCETCHTIETPGFAARTFAHDATAFPLTGRHAPLACDACHKVETRAFPAGHGTARRFSGIGTACAACHADPHAQQFTVECRSCHTPDTFAIARYTHLNARALRSFFTGRHAAAACAACHKPASIRRASTGAAAAPTNYRISTTCTACHTDVHRGALGPRCDSCHRP